MTCVALTSFFKDYQTLVVGAVGFLGVITTLSVNAWIARSVEKRKIAHDKRTLRTALVEEMKVQCEALKTAGDTLNQAKASGDEKQRHVLLPLHRFTDVFDKSIEKLGLLGPPEVAAVLDAYLHLKGLTSKIQLIALRVPPHERGIEFGEAPEEFALIPLQDANVVAEMHLNELPSFNKAIQILSSNQS
jgi:hypothetical protein